MRVLRCVGGCVSLFLLALALDVLGLALLFVGIFANLRVHGRFYGDFLIYTGALVVFLSLACWLMWYVANVPLHEHDEHDERPESRGGLARLARKLSERLSRRLQGDDGHKRAPDDVAPRKAGRVTWGRATAYSNEGYVHEPGDEEYRPEPEADADAEP